MDKKDITYGIIGILTILTIFGGGYYLNQDELNNAYICLATEEVGIFYGGISSTGLTAYPYKENNSGYVRCYASNGNKSSWIKLSDYIKDNGLPEIRNIGKQYICDLEKCVEKQ